MVKPFNEFRGVAEADQSAPNPEGETSNVEGNEAPPALFATIHHKSDARPNGYSPEDIEDLNRQANPGLFDEEDDQKQDGK